jgi:S1-C subfamily serine protease
MKNKIFQQKIWLILILTGLFFLLSFLVFFGISYFKNKELSTLWPSVFNLTKESQSERDTAEQIAKLKKEIEELKNQSTTVVYKTSLVPATSSSVDNLKTKEELSQAKEQIISLGDQLKQLQSQQSQQSVATPSDADLINSWKAEERVVRVACQDSFFKTWQLGSGVLISSDGKVLTNQHVVKSDLGLAPDFCLVLFSKDFNTQSQTYAKQYKAAVTGFFQDRDAALLKIQDILVPEGDAVRFLPASEPFSYFSLASGKAQIGQSVYVIGFPESAGFAFSVTKGIISNLASGGIYFGTDAQIDRGNSGGAAVNSAGQLIGLPTWKFVSSGDYRGYILDINSINL